jgi:trafficking protein particle complex subunit 11
MSLSHRFPAYLNEEYPITIEITNSDNKELDVTMDVLLQPTDLDYAGMCLQYYPRQFRSN